MTSGLFTAFVDLEQYAVAVDDFLDNESPIPVWTGERDDLKAGIALAETLYSGSRQPDPVDYGVVLGAQEMDRSLAALAAPLARRWLTAQELLDGLETYRDNSVLIVGAYPQLRSALIRPLLLASHDSTMNLSFLGGRDLNSLAWNIAKQYAETAHGTTEFGLFTDADRPPKSAEVRVFDTRDLDRADIRAEILTRRWRRVVFQGHGKDESINLGFFTICGRNEHVSAQPGAFQPRCAHGWSCYKPADKLITAYEVPAVEVVLSACNSGPLPDLALFDPKYQLMLNALDGPARTVVSAVSVHDSARPENVAWIHGAPREADSVILLNASLADCHPYPAFMRFGMPGAASSTPAPAVKAPDELVLQTGRRLTSMLAGHLLPHNHVLRPRLATLARKVDDWAARSTDLADQPPAVIRTALASDLASLDYLIAGHVAANPESEIMRYPAYFGNRSSIDPNPETFTCHCGNPAQRFVKRGLLPYTLDTICGVCMRCGDVTFQVPESPDLLVYAEDVIEQGETLDVRLQLTAPRKGTVHVGLFVPTYVRMHCVVEPALTKVRVRAESPCDVDFRITVSNSAPPHFFYMVGFAVQDLAITTARRHFGVLPGRHELGLVATGEAGAPRRVDS
ncbi:hypothetical protein ABZ942_19450 [Nocardia sp. NPDC046473]|uniref:hypothetical protein n=1 Tax=Nocardia sp. NPDC046473 TaxID=3155733 RepID=UPI0033C640DF